MANPEYDNYDERFTEEAKKKHLESRRFEAIDRVVMVARKLNDVLQKSRAPIEVGNLMNQARVELMYSLADLDSEDDWETKPPYVTVRTDDIRVWTAFPGMTPEERTKKLQWAVAELDKELAKLVGSKLESLDG